MELRSGDRKTTLNAAVAPEPEPPADAPTVEKFGYALRRRFSTLTRAWKVGLDPLDHGKLTFQQCARLPFRLLTLGKTPKT